MSTENRVLDVSAVAAEDLTNDQFRFVVLTSAGVRRLNSATEVPYGILQNAPGSGMAAAIRLLGISLLEANGVLGVGDFVSAEYVDAADAGKGQSAALALQYARGMVTEGTDEEGQLASVLLIGPVPAINDSVAHVSTVTTDSTAGANTWTAAELIGGLLLRDPAGASRNDVTPTAALIVAGIPGCIAGSSFEFTIKNTADADELLTLTAGAGVTLSGGMSVPYNHSRRFLAVVTDAGAGTEAVTIYSFGLEPNTAEKFSRSTVTTVTTVGAATLTAASLVGGLILRDPAGAARNDVFSTAALIVAAMPGGVAGSSFEFTIKNTADADELLTLTAGVGITLSGGMTIPYNHSRRFLAIATNAGAGTEAVTIYGLGLEPNTSDKFSRSTVSSDTTADAITYTAAQLVGGLILRDPNGAGRADVSPTAALLVAAMPGAVVGSSFEFTIRNTANGNETITLTAGNGVTLSGTMTVEQNNSKRFLVVCDNVGAGTEAVTIYSLGTIVH